MYLKILASLQQSIKTFQFWVVVVVVVVVMGWVVGRWHRSRLVITW